MKKTKNSIVFIRILVVAVTVVLISLAFVVVIAEKKENQSQNTQLQNNPKDSNEVECLPTLAYFSTGDYEPVYSEIKIEEQSWFADAVKAEEDFQVEVNNLSEDLCQYINEIYDMSWKAVPIDSYVANVTENIPDNTPIKYGACYYKGKLYIDSSLGNKLKGQLRYVVSHELFHYLYEINSKKERFALKNGDLYTGVYLEEAFIDSLAKKYMLMNFPDMDENLLKSGYKIPRLCVDLMELSIPNLFFYFLNNDIQGMQKEIDRYSKTKLVCEESSFEIWASLIDECILTNDENVLSDRVSLLLTYTAYLTPKEREKYFLSRGEEEGMDLSIFEELFQ